jgi:hypothetical protein
MLFIPTRNNIVVKRRDIDNIWRSTQDKEIRSLLRRARCFLDLREPHKPPMDIADALVVHLVRGGFENPNLTSLFEDSIQYMEHAISDLRPNRWPMEMYVLSIHKTQTLGSFLELLPKTGAISSERNDLLESVRKYEDLFPSSDIVGGSFQEMIHSIGEGEGHLGRSDIYPRILGEIYGWQERFDVLEERILIELYKELPRLKRASFELKERLNTTMDSEEILHAISKVRRIEKGKVMQTVEHLRDRLVFWGLRRIIDFPQERDTGLIETPEHLRSLIGSGGYMNMNGLIGKPVNDLYITTDRGSENPWSFPEIFLFLIEEELGRRAHYLNSILRPHGNVRKIDLISGTTMTSIMGAFVDDRLFEVIPFMKEIILRSKELLPGERRLLDHIQESYSIEELVAELEFLISRKRVLELLSGVADIRINTGSQSILEFIRWANIITGMEKHILMEPVMKPISIPGHQASQQMISIELRDISLKLRKHSVSIKDFNTMSTRMGFSPWRHLRERIKDI